MAASKKILITGGVKSGKSSFALDYCNKLEGKKIFIATAKRTDAAMIKKIKRHQEERGGMFETLEEPLYLADALSRCQTTDFVLIDCLTLWVNNLLYHFEDNPPLMKKEINLFLDTLDNYNGQLCIVTNEVGLGIIPENALAQTYMDLLGRINQLTAQSCNEVIMMISGIPQWVKGVGNYEYITQKI